MKAVKHFAVLLVGMCLLMLIASAGYAVGNLLFPLQLP